MTGNEREINHAPSFLLSPHYVFPPPQAASTTHLPCHPKQNRPLGISLAPKTQLRHQGKARPVWQGCLAPNTDAGALNGRGAKDPQTQRPPGPLYLVTSAYPQDLLVATSCLSRKKLCPSSCCPVAFWAFLHPHPHLLLPYQITGASFINAELLAGGGCNPAGICDRGCRAKKWAVLGSKVRDKATECGHSSGLCFLPDKMEKGWGLK